MVRYRLSFRLLHSRNGKSLKPISPGSSPTLSNILRVRRCRCSLAYSSPRSVQTPGMTVVEIHSEQAAITDSYKNEVLFDIKRNVCGFRYSRESIVDKPQVAVDLEKE